MKEVKFTQFLRPNGKQVSVNIQLPDEISEMADYIYSMDGRLTVEELMTGNVSLACEYGERDISIRLGVNGPQVITKAQEMIVEAHGIIVRKVDEDG